MLEAESITKIIGQRTILDSVSLKVEPGEILALVGPNGAGKSTFLRIVANLTRPNRGRILWQGKPWEENAALYRSHLGVVAHDTFLYDHLTAYENLQFYGRMFGVPDLDARITELLGEVGLTLFQNDLVASFSRGMQQRLALARALLHRPKLLLLDEPFSGLDQGGGAMLSARLRRFREEGGMALLVSHDFPETLAVADRFLILSKGRVAEEGSTRGLSLDAFEARYNRITGGAGRTVTRVHFRPGEVPAP